MQLLIGADPELFLREKNKFISGYGVIPGTKAEPFKVDKGAVQVDGMALEFNIDPSETAKEFVHNINTVLVTLRAMVPSQYDLTLSATADFDREYMAAMPEEARALGCDPDFNAYTGDVNPPPVAHPTMRTAAGHVHLGWTKDQDPMDPAHFSACVDLCKQMDYYLGVPSILVDKDDKRRELYGKPGAFRPKPYGMEYRVLSNYWLKDENHMNAVFSDAKSGFKALINQGYEADKDIKKQVGVDARDIINSKDTGAAKLVCRILGLRVGKLL